MEKMLMEKEATISLVKGNIVDLKTNLEAREKQRLNQDETICVLQNSLKMCQQEIEVLHCKVSSLETKKCEVEKDYQKQIQGFQVKICELQKCLKQSEDSTLSLKGGVRLLCKTMFSELKAQYLQTLEEEFKGSQYMGSLQNANLELATLAGHLQEDLRLSQLRLSEAHHGLRDTENKHQRAEAALQVVIANLKESETQCREKLCKKEDTLRKMTNSVQSAEGKLKETNAELEKRKLKLSETENKLLAVCDELKLLKDKNEEQCNVRKEEQTNMEKIRDLKDQVKCWTKKTEELESKLCETENRLQAVTSEYNDLKIKAEEKSSSIDKLHMALSQLSNKLVTERLDNKGCIKHYQEECTKFETLYNNTAYKLGTKETEMALMIQEMNQLKSELDRCNSTITQEKEEDSCPFLLERVKHLTKEAQIAYSCQKNYEIRFKELNDKCSRKEDEIMQLKTQLKLTLSQKDKLLMELEKANEEIIRLKICNSDLCSSLQKLEQKKAEMAEQLRNMQRMICESQSSKGGLQPNIEVQREISGRLTTKLRTVKQQLHNSRMEFSRLQTAYENLEKKYNLLKKGERDLETAWDSKTHCTPYKTKSSKSLTQFRHSEGVQNKDSTSKRSRSKSCHRDISEELRHMENNWKLKLHKMLGDGECEVTDLIYCSSSSS